MKLVENPSVTIPKFLSRISFYIIFFFAYNNNDSRINEMLYSKFRSKVLDLIFTGA